MMKMFLCAWEVVDGVESSYIDNNYTTPRGSVLMRFDKKTCIIAYPDDGVPRGLELDPKVAEWKWDSTKEVSAETKEIMTTLLSLDAQKVSAITDCGVALSEKIFKRILPKFDMTTMAKWLDNEKCVFIDLINNEMDL